MAAILKIQNGGLNSVCANANINFWISYALTIPKCIGLLISKNFERKYIVNLTMLLCFSGGLKNRHHQLVMLVARSTTGRA